MDKNNKILLCILIVVIGIVIGSASFTFVIANGFSYLSSDSRACNHCHVMHEVSSDYAKSPHKNLTCSACHLPHSFVRKWMGKAQSGIHHALAFTFNKNLPAHFQASETTKKWVQENCISCHQNYASPAIHPSAKPDTSALSCVSCHPDVGHRRGF